MIEILHDLLFRDDRIRAVIICKYDVYMYICICMYVYIYMYVNIGSHKISIINSVYLVWASKIGIMYILGGVGKGITPCFQNPVVKVLIGVY